MGYIRLFADKDTSIQDRKVNEAVAKAGPSANFGASETLSIANRFSPDGWAEHYIKRLLIQFNLSSLTSAVGDGSIKNFSDNTVSATLKMFNVIHDQLNPEGFNLNVYPVLSAWSEGVGTDPGTSPLTGYANWDYRKAGTLWDDPGLSQSGANGSFTASTDVDMTASSQTTQFDNGWENMNLDVKSIVTNWVDGLSTNNGLLVTLDETFESVTSYDVGVKKFYGRTTNTVYQPYIEIQYDDYIKDDRNFVPKGTTANLAFYNVINGRYQDITSDGYGTSTGNFLGTVTLYGATASDGSYAALTGNESGSTLTASRVKKGVYKTNFGLALGEYREKASSYGSAEYGENFFDDTLQNDYQYFRDIWTITSNHPLTALSTSSITSTWKASDIFYNAEAYNTSDLIINIRNFKQTYNHNSKALFRLFIEERGDSTNLITLTAALDTITSETVTSGWFKILDEATNREVLSYLELDYDKDGNFFEIDMSILDTGREYRIVLKLNYLGEEKILDTSLFVFSVI